ncbi:RICIN domain-containing protein [Streptomyces sp. NPDC004539]|uniref:RICIN domain-containing protein n=1 Tax=Streptomyces sp. NPDC004539 TaxID=3154280 RepID=UPI0033AA6E1D
MKTRRTRLATLTTALTAALLAFAQTPASAAPSGWHYLDNNQTGQSLHIRPGADAWTKDFSVPGHKFAFNLKEGGYYEIVRDSAVWTCLDSNHAGAVYGLNCNNGDYQRWRVDDLGSRWIERMQRHTNVYRIVNKATGRCLDANYDGAVYTLPCNGGNYQVWYHLAPWR